MRYFIPGIVEDNLKVALLTFHLSEDENKHLLCMYGGCKINLSIIDLPSLLSRAKQMKCIGQHRFHLCWKTEGSFHVRGGREGQTPPV